MPRDSAFLVAVLRKGFRKETFEEILEELSELTRSAGGAIVGQITSAIERPTSNLFISQGKLLEIKAKTKQVGANVLIFNVDLSPIQARNIESITGIRAVDRTGLIIDIFARRAQSRAGRLQVELAQLVYLLPRLVGYGVIMSRTGGGIGTRGPGEQKLEVDRRKTRDRIGRVKKELEKLKTHQRLVRKRRQRKAFPLVAIVGYTNSGKSALLNALTGANVLVEDKLFATLDPTTRILSTPGKKDILLTDTVGFLANLPHTLVQAFLATLEEVTDADVLVHVLDISNPSCHSQYESVWKVLEELKAETKPSVLALNKIDLLDEVQVQQISRKYLGGVPISAKYKLNLGRLVEKIHESIERKEAQLEYESTHSTAL
ncbi:MAG: GTPase HflX [Omnitrophica bacterium RIFCSPLOWO2_01_FULL_45_10b]|nr:MAG: GTPase HflX [Omnitrophica bacterium RIFCSPLOWO2_01_FULL_45_10b]